jgi:hypothetical protein
MPSEPSVHQHRWQAQHNEDLLNQTSLPPDWEVTVRFYAVAHWVRAYLKKALGVPSHTDHQETDQLLQRGEDSEKTSYSFSATSAMLAKTLATIAFTLHLSVLDKMREAHQRLRSFFEPKTR